MTPITSGICAQEVKSDDVIGTWLTEDKTGEISIFKRDGRYFGKIVGGTSNESYDVHNPDKERRNDPLIGLVILKDLTFDADDKVWEDDTVYDPKKGKRYGCTVKLTQSKTLNITGYIGFSWIGRSEE